MWRISKGTQQFNHRGMAVPKWCRPSIHLVQEEWMNVLMDDKKDVDVIYLDFATTFDCVKRNLIFCKLRGMATTHNLSPESEAS